MYSIHPYRTSFQPINTSQSSSLLLNHIPKILSLYISLSFSLYLIEMEMGGKNLKCLTSVAFICVFVWCFSLQNCHAREGRHLTHTKTGSGREIEKKVRDDTGFSGRHRHVHRHRGGSGPSRSTSGGRVGSENIVGVSLASKGGSSNFNVLDFGAKGDGRADDTKVNLGLHLLHHFPRRDSQFGS